MRALIIAAVVGATLAAPGRPAVAQEAGGGLSVELNKLEEIDGGCRSFFLFRNETGTGLTAFEMALAILGSGGVIDRLLTIDAAPLPTGRTMLKIFEMPQIACAQVGEILLHDIPACAAEDGSEPDCFALLALSSLADAPLTR